MDYFIGLLFYQGDVSFLLWILQNLISLVAADLDQVPTLVFFRTIITNST